MIPQINKYVQRQMQYTHDKDNGVNVPHCTLDQ